MQDAGRRYSEEYRAMGENKVEILDCKEKRDGLEKKRGTERGNVKHMTLDIRQ